MIRFLIFFASIIFSSPAFSADGTEGREQDYDFWLSRFLSVSYPLKTISVTSRYGSRKDPFTGKKAFHNGIDLKARYDTVYAMFDGVVQDIGSDGRSGHYFRIRHGLYTISYCHLSRRFINAGDSVFAGMMIGVSGGTGRSTAPHLHLVVKKSDKLVNPDILLRFITRTRSEAMRYLGICIAGRIFHALQPLGDGSPATLRNPVERHLVTDGPRDEYGNAHPLP